ncbi:EAL domain-containing protein [Duganella sp. FT50W]|uniref:EAL domain-containing protein n=1 Tax=Duganella lactea TaxID=2692173 RepID=A0A6L8MM06_9BURK|nr:GGDEF domain-containing phosphodiesterase [Duganella lactea]MYM81505.1 EAL domain-containing protein [Duganella lactea]
MNASIQSYILFSLVADLSLCVVLLLVWLRQRNEWQALFWAASQLALSLGTVAAYLGPDNWLRPLLTSATLTVAVGGIWAGAEYFRGTLQRKVLRPALLAGLAGWAALYAGWLAYPGSLRDSTAALLGLTMLWAGVRLSVRRSYYLPLGLILLARGGFNLLNAMYDLNLDLQFWFAYSVLIKTLTMLWVVAAVQEKIQRRHAHTLDSMTSGLLLVDHHGVVREANRVAARLLDCESAVALVGGQIGDHLSGSLRDLVADYLRDLRGAGACVPLTRNIQLHRQDGVTVPLDVMLSAYEEGGQPCCMLQLIDVSERQQKDQQLYRAAHYDQLTGTFNRSGLLQQLEHCEAPYAVLVVDLDQFQRINDCFGRAVGDQLLLQVSEGLRQQLSQGDLLARLGGNKFALVLHQRVPGSVLPQAELLAARLPRAMHANLAQHEQPVALSASIGIACQPEHGRAAGTLLDFAATAMYTVKKTGRGAFRVFDPAMNLQARDAVRIDAALRQALKAGELHLLYQPIVATADRRLRKVEALVRWHSPTLGSVPPDRFIPVAEESGLVVELGAWVLGEACRQLAAWGPAAGALAVSVNISPRQLTAPGFAAQVRQLLDSHGIAPQRLELELTERVLIDEGQHTREVLAHLSQIGVRISLDDFGTGYSSLSYLTQFRIDTLKIDRSFITDIEHCPRSTNLVTTIVRMGLSLGMELVAEGVETAAQAEALAEMGCHCLQGYVISRPVAADAVPAMVSYGA